MKCEVSYFGMIAESLASENEILDLKQESFNLDDLHGSFIKKYPILQNMTFKIAVDGVLTNSITKENVRTIALLPPFAGG